MTSHTVFKNIRNCIQRYDASDLVRELLRNLNHPDATAIERLRVMPIWYLLLLLKWTFMYGDFENKNKHTPLTKYHFNQLVNRVHNLSEAVRKPSEYNNWLLFLRNMAFQQFWLQEPYTKQRFARQYFLFADLDENHTLQGIFYDSTGIAIDEYLELSMALMAYFLTKEKVKISVEWFSSMENSYSSNTITNFLDSMSITFDEAREWLKNIDKSKKEKETLIDYEFYEQSPFTRFPLLKHENEYFCITPILLQATLPSFVYDVLRDTDAQSLMTKFGDLFENLVAQSLQAIQNQMLTEADLNNFFGKSDNQKVVDYLIVSDDHNIFIDAKGVAMSWIGMVTHQPGTIRNQTKSSILKGIEQIYSLSNRLGEVTDINGIRLGEKENYALIVTFKDLYVSNGQNFRDLIAPDDIDKIIAKYGGQNLLPLSNIYIISIDDLDILIGCAIQASHSMSDILGHAVQSDKSERTKFVFRQHVFDVCPQVDMLPILDNSLDELMNELRSKIND